MPTKKTATKARATKKLAYTRRALRQINNAPVRRDFLNFVNGVEYGLAKRDQALVRKCMNDLVTMTYALNRTITPAVAIGILDGVLDDARQLQISRLPFKKHKDHFCKFGIGCLPKKGRTCYTFSTPVCGGTSGFVFHWKRVSV